MEEQEKKIEIDKVEIENKKTNEERRKPSMLGTNLAMKIVSNVFLLALVSLVFVFGFYVGAVYKDVQVQNSQIPIVPVQGNN